MGQIADEQITSKLRDLLKEVDLQTTTERQLRKALEEEFQIDLSDRKEIIRAEVTSYLEQHQAEQQQQQDEDEQDDAGDPEEDGTAVARPSKRKASGGFGSGWLSPDMQDFLGEERLPRTQVVKRLWEYIKENELQNPKDKRKIVLDDKLSKLFKPPLNMFTMNTQISRHCQAPDGDEWPYDNEASVPKKAKQSNGSAPKKKRTKKSAEDGAAPRASGFQKKLLLSQDMADWLGASEASRAEVVSHFWKYVKDNNLQDPANKQQIIADDQLYKLFGERRFAGFGVAKFFKPHFVTGKDDS